MSVISDDGLAKFMGEPLKLRGTAGIDEAGRGPMLGPMVICGLRFDTDSSEFFSSLGIKDSKLLTPKKREGVFEAILEESAGCAIREISAQTIDTERARGISLNEIELEAFVDITRELLASVVYVDAADVKAERFGSQIAERSGLLPQGLKVVSEHRADLTYPIVSAASIIAKVTRDRNIERLHEVHGDFGSGYPSDSKTVQFMKQIVIEGGEMPSFVRRSWESVRRLIEEYQTEQTSLDSF